MFASVAYWLISSSFLSCLSPLQSVSTWLSLGIKLQKLKWIQEAIFGLQVRRFGQLWNHLMNLITCIFFFNIITFSAFLILSCLKGFYLHINKFCLWFAGHFMGKKSVMDAPLLPSAEGQQGGDALEVNLPAEQSDLVELFHQFLRVALQAQVDTQESRMKKPGEWCQNVFFCTQKRLKFCNLIWHYGLSVSGGGHVDEDFRKLHPKQKVIQRGRLRRMNTDPRSARPHGLK